MRRRAGFTLLELLVSLAVGSVVIAAAVVLTVDHSKVLGRASSRLDMHQRARLSADLLAQDLRHAGVGVGYRPDGRFAGLLRGTFSVPGGATFEADDRAVTLASGALVTDDVGIRQAVGDMRSIAAFGAGSAEICAGASFEEDEVVVLATREGIHARTVRIGPLSSSGCSRDACVGGCESFSFTNDTSYVSDSWASSADYAGGEVAGRYQEVVWFLVPDAAGRGLLQRAEVTAAQPCAAADTSCGGLVAEGVESLQLAVWLWDDLTGAWVDRTTATDITGAERIRVDIELVTRGLGTDPGTGPQEPVALELASGVCAPMPCGERDQIPRWVTRSSVEIRNSGRMMIR